MSGEVREDILEDKLVWKLACDKCGKRIEMALPRREIETKIPGMQDAVMVSMMRAHAKGWVIAFFNPGRIILKCTCPECEAKRRVWEEQFLPCGEGGRNEQGNSD